MPLDYSKWDNIDTGSEDEEEARREASRKAAAQARLAHHLQEENARKARTKELEKLTGGGRPAEGEAPAKRGRTEGGGGGSSGSGAGPPDLDLPCPPELGPRGPDVWKTLKLEQKIAIIRRLTEGAELRMSVEYHPEKSLHKDLFNPGNWERWIHPALLTAISAWRAAKDSEGPGAFSKIDLDAFEGMRVEAPGIISFPAFTDEFCQILLEEVKHYRASGMPSRRPNSMNNYGLVLNEIGLRPVFTALLREAFLPVGARLFGDDAHRVADIRGVAAGTENWGGSSLDDHHSFVVQYQPSNDKHLDMHIDECDVTFNFGITPHEDFEGSDLTFCGMFDAEDHRKYHFMYKHAKGRCVVHSGKRRHGAMDIEKGERASLIMWTKSRSYRNTEQYEKRNNAGLRMGPADRVCLSYTHDKDYKALMPKKLQYNMKPRQDGEDAASSAASTAPAPTERRWERVCADGELREGGAKMIALEPENEQVSVFRHRGELFAMDNRCAHMGGPLCEGDIEDLGTRAKNMGMPIGGRARAEDGAVKCPRHGMCFNLRTGENIKGGHMKQKVYPVRVLDGYIEVEVDREVSGPTGGAEAPPAAATTEVAARGPPPAVAARRSMAAPLAAAAEQCPRWCSLM